MVTSGPVTERPHVIAPDLAAHRPLDIQAQDMASGPPSREGEDMHSRCSLELQQWPRA